MDPETLRLMAIAIFEQAREQMVETGGRDILGPVFEQILGLDYPTGDESPRSVREGDLARAVYHSHATGVRRVVETVVIMIREGVLKLDPERVSGMAAALARKKDGAERWQFKPGPDGDDADDGNGRGNSSDTGNAAGGTGGTGGDQAG
jgi:hypothetical protein